MPNADNHRPTKKNLLIDLDWAATNDATAVLKRLDSSEKGLRPTEVQRRLQTYGHNLIKTDRVTHWYHRLFTNLKDPLVFLLFALGVISYATGDKRAAAIIGVMLFLSISLRFLQEMRADHAAEKLKAMVRTTVTVVRHGIKQEVPLEMLALGDIVQLSAGDFVPADLRLINSKDLYANQASLTGESLPVEKHAPPAATMPENPLDLQNICFMGTNIGSGTAVAVVIATGSRTRFGKLAAELAEKAEVPTSFDRGIDRYAWLMIRFVMVMVPSVFLINGLSKGDWLEAFLFAVAVAVGLTPELLPMIVTVNLSKGALDMSRRKVIVKRLNAIQDFGAMNILCTDKTGTLTQGKVALVKYVDLTGRNEKGIYNHAYLNSFYQTGLNNMLDEAVIKYDDENGKLLLKTYQKVDELPFDFRRRRMSVIVEDAATQDHILICKGAIEEMSELITSVQINGQREPMSAELRQTQDKLVTELNTEGFRLLAIAIRRQPSSRSRTYTISDENDLTLLGFLAFLDPPKETAAEAIAELNRYGVQVKILTGDNELITRQICNTVGLSIHSFLRGKDIEGMTDDGLALAAEEATVFDKLEPQHKERVIKALQSRGHVVGFLGDGINDAPALKAADVGISVDGATDIAKESSDIILLERSLVVLKDGVLEGRRAFGNIVKYIKMTASSNFGNMFSVVGGSIFLPFIPMLPLQVIINNLMYDLSQTAIPTDSVDEEYLIKPRQWKINRIRQFILAIGPVSSIFDYATYFLMLYVFNCFNNPTLFHTGWFVESLLTQTLIIHVIRTNKVPFFQSRASLPLTLTTASVVGLGIYLPYSPLAASIGFAPLPWNYWLFIAGFLVCYFFLTQLVKNWFIHHYGQD